MFNQPILLYYQNLDKDINYGKKKKKKEPLDNKEYSYSTKKENDN